jgi:addiction module HigA family antidote
MKILANNLIPFSPTHPGEILKDEIKFINISQRKLAKQMGVSYTVLNEMLNLKRSVSVEFTLRVEAVLGVEAEMLLNMQSRYNIQTARTDKTLMQQINKIDSVI